MAATADPAVEQVHRLRPGCSASVPSVQQLPNSSKTVLLAWLRRTRVDQASKAMRFLTSTMSLRSSSERAIGLLAPARSYLHLIWRVARSPSSGIVLSHSYRCACLHRLTVAQMRQLPQPA